MTQNISIKKKRKPIFSIKEIVRTVLPIVALSLLIMLAFQGTSYESINHFFLTFLWAFAICSTQWFGHGLIFEYLDKKISWIQKPVKRAVWGLLSLIVYSSLAFYFIQFFFLYLFSGNLPQVSWSWIVGHVFYPVAISFVITITLTAIDFFKAWKKYFIKAEKLNAEVMSYKYEVLRNQINPHFLFNSFNTLTDLVYENQDLAVDFIQQLSKLFRYVIDSREKELVPLKEEMDFANSYLYLLKTRFDNKLQLTIEVEVEKGEMIIPVSIQTLIENAAKHNEISESFPLKVKISKNADYIFVTNSLKCKTALQKTTKIGLKNLEQQFAFFTNKNIVIEKTNQEFSVGLPIIKL